MKTSKLRENLLPILQIAVSLAVIVLSVLGLAGTIENVSGITTPILGVLLLLQACSNWKRRKGIAIFSLCASAFVIFCSVVVLIAM